MKKKYRAALAVGLCMGILAVIQQTPENSIVKQKNADNIKKYETSKGSIQEMVQRQSGMLIKLLMKTAYL